MNMKKNQKKNKKYYRRPRDQHWTEEPQGRRIDFAEKYEDGADAAGAYDAGRTQKNNTVAQKARAKKRRRRVLTALGCVLLICIGYIGADVFIIRHAAPLELAEQSREQQGNLTELTVEAKAFYRESISLDGAVMLSSVIDDAIKGGYTGVTFDAKRSDGTIGYRSALALVDTFGAISSPASSLKQSVEKLRENDILPIARISCYLDNVAPLHSPEMALMNGDTYYMDADGNTYLNPDSEMTYNYIRDIIKECSSCGITVFLLADCDLPEAFAGAYGDGFEALSEKLSADLGTSVKLLCEVPVSVEMPEETEAAENGDNDAGDVDSNDGEGEDDQSETNPAPAALQAAIEAFPAQEENRIYLITADVADEELKPYLEEAGITSYIIREA